MIRPELFRRSTAQYLGQLVLLLYISRWGCSWHFATIFFSLRTLQSHLRCLCSRSQYNCSTPRI